MRILLIGAPASGKGTIGKLLSEKLNLPLINTGKLLRSIPKKSTWYQEVNDDMKNGRMVSSTIVGGMLQEEVLKEEYKYGYILDGWVRQRKDLNHFDPEPDIVIYLSINKETSVNRIVNRYECIQNRHSYNLLLNPPKEKGICDLDKSKLIKRTDDSKEILDQRWQIFENETLFAIEDYKNEGKLIVVNSTKGTPKEIFEQTMDKLKAKLKIND